MTSLLLRLFVKDYKKSHDSAVHCAVGKLAGTVGILCNILLFLGKFTVGLMAGSAAITADAINNLLDASSSIVTLVGFRLAQRPADHGHPYGHGRYEYLAGLLIAGIILLSGGDQARTAIEKIISPTAVELSTAIFLILGCSIAVKLWMFFFYRKLGKHIGSTTLKATAIDSRNDVIASTAVLLACGIGKFWTMNIDGYAALAVALFILYSGIRTTGETVSPLLGKKADDELIEAITEVVLSHEQILGIHDLLVHDYGPGKCYASVHAEMSAAEDPVVSHEIIDHIEREMLERMQVHLVIHFDPVIEDS
jgi:cation diffusion facilitator family transporter